VSSDPADYTFTVTIDCHRVAVAWLYLGVLMEIVCKKHDHCEDTKGLRMTGVVVFAVARDNAFSMPVVFSGANGPSTATVFCTVNTSIAA